VGEDDDFETIDPVAAARRGDMRSMAWWVRSGRPMGEEARNLAQTKAAVSLVGEHYNVGRARVFAALKQWRVGAKFLVEKALKEGRITLPSPEK
jgi:hypothetical protein